MGLGLAEKNAITGKRLIGIREVSLSQSWQDFDPSMINCLFMGSSHSYVLRDFLPPFFVKESKLASPSSKKSVFFFLQSFSSSFLWSPFLRPAKNSLSPIFPFLILLTISDFNLTVSDAARFYNVFFPLIICWTASPTS